MKIEPYIKINNEWTIPDSAMQAIFHKMKEFGLVKKVWCEGQVKTEEDFITYLQNKQNHMVALFGDDHAIMAINWINGITRNSAFLHFCLMPEVWGIDSFKIGNAFIRYWFDFKDKDGRPMFDVLLGKIPVTNRTAIRFMKKSGMTVMGEIPKASWDYYRNEYFGAVLAYAERESFLNG
jgi:hypothetical protein